MLCTDSDETHYFIWFFTLRTLHGLRLFDIELKIEYLEL